MFRFVHLSDIHFGQEAKDGTIYIHDDVRRELITDAQLQRRARGPADGILVVGDIAYSGLKTEFEKAAQWLDQLAEAAGCAKNAVLLIPGNHDVDLDGVDVFGKTCHRDLRAIPVGDLALRLSELAAMELNEHPLHKKLKAYREFAEQYGCDFASSERPVWEKDFTKNNQHILRFVGLNSVQVSNKEDDEDKMILGASQYIIPRAPNVEHVVLLHHPFKWYRDRSDAETYLRSRARIILFGHEHIALVQKMSAGNDHEYLMIDSGATNPPKQIDDFRYRYNWINFEVQGTDASHTLAVRIFPRIWSKERTAFIAEHAKMNLDADESKEFMLTCTQFEVLRPEAITALPAPVRPEGETILPTSPNDEINFEKLRFFFWRYLDWRERLNILARVDVLPATADRPVPQTLERMALSRARELRRLDQIWDETMKKVPVDLREPNPFNPGQV